MFRLHTLYYHLHVLRSVGRSHVNSELMICHVSFSSCLFLSGKMVNLKHSLTIPVILLCAYVVMYISFVYIWITTMKRTGILYLNE